MFATNEELYADLDLRSRHERQMASNAEAMLEPRTGDYWHEMFVPISLVIERVGDQVATFEHYIQHKDGYSYDTSKVTRHTLEAFKARVKHAYVVRNSKRIEVIEQWRVEGGQP